MNWQTWIAYAAVVLVVIITPGPAAALCMTHAAVNGSRHTLTTIAGLLLSSLTLISLSAVGLGAALAASGTLFTIVKFAGAAYLVFLGIRIWRSPPPPELQAATALAQARRATKAELLRTGYLVGLSNPKDLLFFAALFPQFMTPEHDTASQLLLLAFTWLVIAGSIMFCYAIMGYRLSAALQRFGPRNLFNRLTGGALVAAGAFLAVFRRSST